MSTRRTKAIQQEFTRQAAPMSSAAAFQAEPVIKWIAEAVNSSPSGRVLDLACGPGMVAQVISSRVGEVVGIDGTPEMVRLARRRFEKQSLTNGRFSIASAEALPFQDACFDQVLTRLAFHHFEDVPAVLAEARRVLLSGGWLIVADVVSSGNREEAKLHNTLERLRDPTHVRMFSEEELLQVVQEAGFKVLQADSWKQARAFPEWASIVADSVRTEPLESIMRTLARAGQTAGIALREEGGELVFTHTWLFVKAILA